MNRRVLSIADQLVSSASNGLVAVAVAHRENAAGFGAFALAFGLVSIAIGLGRAGVGEVVLIGSRTRGVPTAGRLARYAAMFGFAPALLGVIAASLLHGRLSAYFLSFSLATIVVVAQDVFRFALFALNDYLAALVSDAIWLVLFVIIAVVILLERGSGVSLVEGWAASAAVALAYGAWAFRVSGAGNPDYRFDLPRARSNAYDQGGILVAGQGALAIIAGWAGLVPVGAIRSAQLLFTPATAAAFGLRNIFLGQGAGPSRMQQWVMALAVLGIAWTAAVVALPRSILVIALGETGAKLDRIALAVLLAAEVLRLVSIGLGDGLRSGGGHRRLIIGRTGFTILLLSTAAVSAMLWPSLLPIALARLLTFVVGTMAWLWLAYSTRRSSNAPVLGPISEN